VKPVIEIDGRAFDDLPGFYDEVSLKLLSPGQVWGRNLDALNDLLRGGFGTPEGGFVLRWRHSERSRECLGQSAMVRHLEAVLARCHPSSVPALQERLEVARRGEGASLFDELVSIFRRHGPGGRESEDGVELELA
jgi:RNAse (barnase) inhibitor barstar